MVLAYICRISITVEIQSSLEREYSGTSYSYAGINRIRFKGFPKSDLRPRGHPQECPLF
jgi:hypothetical protein